MWSPLLVPFASGFTPPSLSVPFFSFNATATTEIYTLSLHDALPISSVPSSTCASTAPAATTPAAIRRDGRSEEHTSELQSRPHLVCRLLLEKKKNKTANQISRDKVNHSPAYICTTGSNHTHTGDPNN